jgi:hypothetical protein
MWGGWALFFWNILIQINGGGLQRQLRLRGGKVRLWAALDRNPTFEHCQIMVWILPWKGQTGSTGRFKWSQSAGFSAVIGQFHMFREDHKPLKGGFVIKLPRPSKYQQTAARITPTRLAASDRVKPSGPFLSINSKVASTNAWWRFP